MYDVFLFILNGIRIQLTIIATLNRIHSIGCFDAEIFVQCVQLNKAHIVLILSSRILRVTIAQGQNILIQLNICDFFYFHYFDLFCFLQFNQKRWVKIAMHKRFSPKSHLEPVQILQNPLEPIRNCRLEHPTSFFFYVCFSFTLMKNSQHTQFLCS